ncbi:hypothetical protein EW026_g8002 [Hermanssonia centrifuga]|uniref:ATP-dependent DNA helicase n=1 Tax=Hermanssonia centrifuga TaxID=98765 RepID=A0A4S4K5W2_9APHY|nr:hypothetical protein EW026_g8002 [Hermanssonia centrifuga]
MEDVVKESGEWGPKRMYGFVNGYCPAILLYARCNNDCKLLTNGRETKNISWYVTGYAAKKQGRQHNSSAILAQGYAYHDKHHRADYVDELRDRQRLLIFRLVHAINKEQELSAPMVMSYLMGWGDVYRSHQYTSVFWSSFVRVLLKGFPNILKPNLQSESTPHSEVVETHVAGDTHDNGEMDVEQRDEQVGEDADNESGNRQINQQDSDDMITLEINTDGQLHMKSQVVDYQYRGPELSTYNVHDFFTDTYETTLSMRTPPCPRASSSTHVDDELIDSEDDEADQHRAGRDYNVRAKYQPPHPCAGSKQRVVRTPLHRNVVNYAGQFFPSRHDPTTYPFYCASLLLLLKPWRNLCTDLKPPEQSWEAAFEYFEANASDRIQQTISGIQYFHDCRTAAQDRANDDLPLDDSEEPRTGDIVVGGDDMEMGEDFVEPDTMITEEVVARVLQSQVPPGELQHAKHAVEVAKGAKLFGGNNFEWNVAQGDVLNAVGGDLAQLSKWKEQMSRDVQRVNGEAVVPGTVSNQTADIGSVEQLDANALDTAPTVQINPAIHSGEGTLSAANPAELKDEQFRAFDIIRWHLSETIAGNNPPPLRMILYGEGGTGKSKVIQTITQEFTFRGVESMLAKAAYTGVAASLIDGKTTHTVAALSVKESESQGVTDDAKAKLQTFWKIKRYLIVDEFSMLGKTHVERMERHIAIGKVGGEGHQEGTTWGGVNVIFCGDLHQFPPVAQGKTEFLFHPLYGSTTGQRLYEEFTTVVVLREQMRVTDEVWRDVLVHLRRGEVRRRHIKILRKLVLKPCRAEDNPDFTQAPWDTVSLVTPRHAVRNLWNENAAREFCAKTKAQLFVCAAEDSVHTGRNRSKEVSLAERYAIACRYKTEKRRHKKDLPVQVELAIGMRVLVTENLETDLDLTNGARGEIVKIVLHPDEPEVGEDRVVHLQFLPLYVLVKMSRTRASTLPGLDEGVVPVEPVTSTMKIKLNTRSGKTIQRTVHRRQFPITPAYAFTDYRSQGQTLPYVIVDIASPPTGTLNLFNLYVALSRSAGRHSIRLLRDFDEELFRQSHDPELLIEDERLDTLDIATKIWWQQMGGENRMAVARTIV